MILTIIVVAILTDGRSLRLVNLQNFALQVSIQGIVGFGMTFCLLCGQFDLSIGAVYTLCGIIFAKCLSFMPFVPALIIAIIMGGLMGLLNGCVVQKLGLGPFVGTLSTGYLYEGISKIISEGKPVSIGSNSFIASLGKMRIAGLSIFPYIFILVGIVCFYILTYTRFGRNIYATGGNYEVAKNTGIRVDFYRVMSFAIIGALAGLAGSCLAVRLQSATPIAGDSLGLIALSSVMIGGTKSSGGVGNIQMSLLGLLLIGVLVNAMDLLGIAGYYQQVVRGLITAAVIGTTSYSTYKNQSNIA